MGRQPRRLRRSRLQDGLSSASSIAIFDGAPGRGLGMTDRNLQARAALPSKVQDCLGAWDLEPDGALVATRSSWILPVRRNVPAMLKVARIPDERRGYAL